MKSLDPQEIKDAAAAVDQVRSIDQTIKSLGDRVEGKADEWGSEVRSVLGRNAVSQFTNEHMGQVVFCAIVNALLQLREDTTEPYGHIVSFPAPPCSEQQPQGGQ